MLRLSTRVMVEECYNHFFVFDGGGWSSQRLFSLGEFQRGVMERRLRFLLAMVDEEGVCGEDWDVCSRVLRLRGLLDDLDVFL